MRFLTVCIISISICHASVDAILKNYPFSPDRRYGPSAQQSNKKLEEIRVVGYVQEGAKTYIFLRSEGKLMKVKVGDELDGVRLVGVQRGFLLLRDGNEIKRVKISWDRSIAQDRRGEAPVQKRQDEAQSPPPKQLLELLQEKK